MRFAALTAICLAALKAQAAQPAPFAEVRPVLEAMDELLPPQLRPLSEPAWDSWIRRHDEEIRARLERGELDSMVHLLLFGASFTERPRIEFETIAEASRSGLLRARVEDLVRALQSPGENERLAILGGLLRRNGVDPAAGDGRAGLFLFENLQRVLEENVTYARRAREPGGEPVFRDRGVSLDTGVTANYVVEEALRHLKHRGVLRPGGVTRVAVIGAGLDFTDKLSGYDHYPLQTLQPFALYDSLLRLNLAAAPRVTVFDISLRVLEHLERARERAAQGRGYTIQLVRVPRQGWTPGAVDYWRSFGDRAGQPAAPVPPPAGLGRLDTRAAEIRPEVVLACEPVNLNIVAARLSLPAEERFDLIVATNVFVYYNRLEQALAFQNAAAMLKPGGILLTNDPLPEVSAIPARRTGQTAVRYSERFGEPVFWYQTGAAAGR
jgi:SAM-dependent methyltransferase